MAFLSKLCRCLQDPEDGRRQTRIEASVLANSTENLAQSSQRSPFQNSPVPNNCQHQDLNEALALVNVATQSNNTNILPLSNSRELELEKFRQEIDKWRKWKQNHPDRNWIRAVKDIANENSPFLEVLPDGMIPIRGLVKSLVYICKQGAVFASAKEEVFAFVQEIDKWLDIVYAFDNRDGLRSDVWEVLDEIRHLIGDVIRWSSGLQAVSSQWLSDVSVQSQIQAYREGFNKISTRFGVICGIKLRQSIDNVAEIITEARDNVKRTEFLKQRLQPRLIENESYNAQEKYPCDPETRLDILEEISSWIKDVSESSQCFYWLSGAPGVGKSAITASIAKECLNLGILCAQFFINRNDATTTDPRVLFPTICWRLCEHFPQTVAIMQEALRAQPTLIDDISDDQTSKLFVKAINLAAATDLSQAVVIVIDALDETDTKRLGDLAQIFSKVVTDLPRNAKVFISSRTEDAVTKPFNPLCSHARVKSRYLKATDSIDEVSRYMEKEIKKILRDNDMNWDDLGDETMKTLSSQAAGLFIWAQTTLNFLRDEIQDKGRACFAGLLDVLKTDGMNDIDMLYLAILQKKCKPGDWEYQRFRRIIGAILVRQTPLSISDIAPLLDLKERSNSQPVDLVHFVRQYRTVLVSDTKDINAGVVPRPHRSFADFITSERAKEFRIVKTASHGELALRCIDQLDGLVEYLNPEKEIQPEVLFPAQLVYASVHWQTHLTRVLEPDANNDAEEKNVYDIFDISGPKNDTQSLSSLSAKPDTAEIKWKGLLTLAFSPDGTQFALSRGHTIQIWDSRTGSVIMSLTGHKNHVNSVGFSPDGTQVVSVSLIDTLRIWDTQTGRVLHVIHNMTIKYVTFSHDGRIVATCSLDGTLHTWDSTTGQQLNRFKSHKGPVEYCAFSRNDQRIMSRSFDEIIVWDVNSGSLIFKFEHQNCYMILFCPCGGHVMSCRLDYIRLWDVGSGNHLDHTNSTITQLAFTKESEQESTSNYIHVPPILSEPVDSSTPRIYSLKTEHMTVYGIVEHGQDVWVSSISSQKLLFSSTGATRIDGLWT